MLRSLFVKIFQQNMSLNHRNLRGVPIDLKLNNLDLSGNTTEFKTLPTRSHRYIYCFIYSRWNLSKFVVLTRKEKNILDEYFCTGNLVAISNKMLENPSL